MKLRCSSLPLVSICAQAAHAPSVQISGDRRAADMGSAVHQLLRNHIDTGLNSTEAQIAAVADEWQLAGDSPEASMRELTMLYRAGVKLWASVAQWFPAPQTEVAMEAKGPITLTGHTDVFDFADSLVRVGDHKSGRLYYDATEQVKGYGWLGLNREPSATSAWAVVLRIRDGERIMARWTRDELAAWWVKLGEHLLRDEYTPGPHCRYCPRFHECPAGKEYVRQLGEMIVAEVGGALQLTPLRAIDIMDRLRVLEKVCETLRAAIKTTVASEGGEWSDSDGNTLRVKVEERREINYANGAALLADELGDRFPEVVRIGKTKVEEIVRANAPRGMKSLAIAGLMDRLDAAGAVNIKTVEKLEFQRAPKMIGQNNE